MTAPTRTVIKTNSAAEAAPSMSDILLWTARDRNRSASDEQAAFEMYKTKTDWGIMHPGFEDREIEPNPVARAALPVDTFSFSMPVTWRDSVWTMLNDKVTDAVRIAFREAPPEYLVSDDLSWLDNLIEATSGELVDSKALLATRLRKMYRYFRAGHATRTDDLAPFYNNGLRVLRPEEIHSRVRQLFLRGQHQGASESKLEAAISEVGQEVREGRLYFAAQESSLISRKGSSGHYLIYGSEYLYCIAMRTADTASAKKVLSAIGRPTMFVCDIPMSKIPEGTLEDFSGKMLEYLFADLVDHIDTEVLSPWSGSGLSIREDIAAESIVGHYHPKRIFDPFWNA